MGATCYVVSCKSGYASQKEKTHFFKPKDLKTVKLWEKFIGRKDLKLSKKHSVCHKHFEETDIVKGKTLESKSGPIVYDLMRWKLTDEALPKLLTGKPVSRPITKPPRRILRRTNPSQVLCEVNISTQDSSLTALNNKIPEKFNINLKDVALPLSWFWQQGSLQKQELICSKFKWLDENLFEYTKTVMINEENRTLRYFLRGHQVSHENLKSEFSTIHELYTYIKLFDDAQVCIGNPGLLYNARNFSEKSKDFQSTSKAVQSRSENNTPEESSNPRNTCSQQAQTNSVKFLILRQDNFSKLKGKEEKSRGPTLGDNDMVTDEQSITPVEIRSETFCDTTSIAESAVSTEKHSRSNLPNTSIVNNPQIIPAEDESTVLLLRTTGAAAVNLRYPNEFFQSPISNSKELEQKLVKRSYRCFKSNYNLVSYLFQTWNLGIYTPFKCDFFPSSFVVDQPKVPMTARPPIVSNDWTYFRQPTFLIALPKKIYRPPKVTARDPIVKQAAEKPTLKFANIENMKSLNGKIHVTLNGESLVQLSLSNLFHDESNYYDYQPRQKIIVGNKRSRSGNSTNNNLIFDVEAENDENDLKDLQLSRRLLKKERKRKYLLEKQLRLLFKNYTRNKDLARSILKATKKCRQKRDENEVPEQPKPVIAKKPTSLMKCQQCNKMILVSRMKTHLKVHSGVKPYLCDLCGRAFVIKSSLNSHIRINHGREVKPFMCSTCGYTCRRKQLLDDHERIHTNERPFDCSICDKRFRTKSTLAMHKRTHTGEKPYTCNICAKSYTQSKSLKKHFKRHHENTGLSGAKYKINTGSTKISYHCDFCQKQFWRFLTYEQHRATHTGIPVSIRCGQHNCDFTYSDMKQLKNHMLMHHPEKSFPCDVCEKVFLAKHTLKDHQAMHNPTLGFHCSYCPAILTVKANLIAHEKKHTRETPHECSFCEMRFYSTYLLHIHMRKFHLLSQPKKKRLRKPTENK